MIALRWAVGLSVALIFGGIVTQFYARRIRHLVGDEDHHFRIAIPISLGIAENLFFTIGVAFELSGVMVAMVTWMAAKMAAHWGKKTLDNRVTHIETIRFTVLMGTMVSLLFSMVGGLICAGRLWL